VSRLGGPVTVLELPSPGRPEPDEVLLDVCAAGVGNWDQFVRTGGWDTGIRPPMALGGRSDR
jgi:NADPH:quinone reductase-like Zn-dependent oxidoreductase